jgi:hypothetical protein
MGYRRLLLFIQRILFDKVSWFKSGSGLVNTSEGCIKLQKLFLSIHLSQVRFFFDKLRVNKDLVIQRHFNLRRIVNYRMRKERVYCFRTTLEKWERVTQFLIRQYYLKMNKIVKASQTLENVIKSTAFNEIKNYHKIIQREIVFNKETEITEHLNSSGNYSQCERRMINYINTENDSQDALNSFSRLNTQNDEIIEIKTYKNFELKNLFTKFISNLKNKTLSSLFDLGRGVLICRHKQKVIEARKIDLLGVLINNKKQKDRGTVFRAFKIWLHKSKYISLVQKYLKSFFQLLLN